MVAMLNTMPMILVSTFMLGLCFMETEAAPTVETSVGVIVGSTRTLKVKGTEFTTNRYLGIPYAKPPIGDLRFQKPEPKEKFTTLFNALDFGASCPQSSIPGMPAPQKMSEDCLFLNIFVPTADPDQSSGYAVMVFVHGGGFTMGSGDTFVSDTLAAFGNVIVVTINYRLGYWGFFSTGDERVPGNSGLWDQHLSFRWVHDNIGAFGGDNNRVTIFGESAGGISVSFQALYPQNKGLFQRVISESGTAMVSQLYSTKDPLIPATFIAEKFGCSTTNTDEMISCLNSKEHDAVLEKMGDLMKEPENMMKLSFLPSKDNEFIKCKPNEMTATGSCLQESIEFLGSLDVINGVNSREGGFGLMFTQSEDLEKYKTTREDLNTKLLPLCMSFMFDELPDVVKDLVISEYTDWANPDEPDLLKHQFIKMLGDGMFVRPAIAFSQLHTVLTKEPNSYFYRFSAKPTKSLLPLPSWVEGANHADELGFVFGFDEGMISDLATSMNTTIDVSPWEYELAYDVMTYWTNFAKTGNPNKPNPVSSTWPNYDMTDQEGLILDKEKSVRKFIYAREANFWLKSFQLVWDAVTHVHDEASPFKPKNDNESCKANGNC